MSDGLIIRIDSRQLDRALRQLAERDVRIAATWALNDTAKDALVDYQNRLGDTFDRPTRFARNAFMVWRATPQTLEARVQERPSVSKRHFLKVEEAGGARPMTGLEKRLRMEEGGVFAAAIPTSAARLDAHGNWARGERNQVLAALAAAPDPDGRIGSKRVQYFVPKSARPKGIYRRVRGVDAIKRIVAFVSDPPTYTQRLKFFEGVERVYREKMPAHLSRTIARMIERRSGG